MSNAFAVAFLYLMIYTGVGIASLFFVSSGPNLLTVRFAPTRVHDKCTGLRCWCLSIFFYLCEEIICSKYENID